MRVTMLTTSFPRWEGDHAGSFVETLARAFVLRGHSVHVIAPEPREASPPRTDDITVEHIPYLRPRALERTFYGDGAPENLARDPLAWLGAVPASVAFVHAMRRLRSTDLLVSHWLLPSGIAATFARSDVTRSGSTRHVAYAHSADVFVLERIARASVPMARAIAARIAHHTETVVFSTERHADFFRSLVTRPRTRIVVRPIGAGHNERPNVPRSVARATLGVGETELCVFALGRLVPVKGIDVLVDATRNASGVTVAIGGSGSSARELASRAGTNARFLGSIDHGTRRLWMAASDLFVLPSRTVAHGRTEGAPTVLIEAMHAGLPIIASDVGGVRELVGDAAMLIPPDDPDALAAAIARIRRDASTRETLAKRALNRSLALTADASVRAMER